MNSLSWFLYFADFAVRFQFISALVMLTAAFGLGVTFILKTLEEPAKNSRSLVKGFAIALIVSSSIFCLTPSKNTLYAIAASQLGEKAMESTIGQKTKQALELWIDSQIEGLKKK